MKEGPDISRLAALIGDPARANMLTALMDGRALTASELAAEAGVTLATASGHLARLENGGLVQHRRQGRHKYVALAGPEVAAALEALMGLATSRGLQRVRPGPRDAALREARVCYSHLAGRRGVQMLESLHARGLVTISQDTIALQQGGRAFLQELGIDLAALENGRTTLCRPCLDWSERRTHLAGGLGRALLARMETLGWMRRDTGSRAIHLSSRGKTCFDAAFPTAGRSCQ